MELSNTPFLSERSSLLPDLSISCAAPPFTPPRDFAPMPGIPNACPLGVPSLPTTVCVSTSSSLSSPGRRARQPLAPDPHFSQTLSPPHLSLVNWRLFQPHSPASSGFPTSTPTPFVLSLFQLCSLQPESTHKAFLLSLALAHQELLEIIS